MIIIKFLLLYVLYNDNWPTYIPWNIGAITMTDANQVNYTKSYYYISFTLSISVWVDEISTCYSGYSSSLD